MVHDFTDDCAAFADVTPLHARESALLRLALPQLVDDQFLALAESAASRECR